MLHGHLRRAAGQLLCVAPLLVTATLCLHACAPAVRPPKEIAMPRHATGPFDVKVTPVDTKDRMKGIMTIEKKFHGDLDGESQGEMFTSETAVEGSAGYVARERITGSLLGKQGGFTVQHIGTMQRAGFQLRIEIIPDSGTGELTGITGTMKIVIAPDGKHSYEVDYELAER
jgi:Protein of unknown function (DUF3224)